MKLIPVRTGRGAMWSALALIIPTLTMPVLCAHAAAQDQTKAETVDAVESSPQPKADLGSYQTFYLADITSQRDANDIQTDLRNMLPRAKIYYVASQRALSIEGSAADLQSARKILADIEHPRRSYRLTYSLTEVDGDKTLSTQKVSLIALDSGDKTIFKQGSKVPIVTGSTSEGASTNTQVQYEDIGLTIEATVEGSPDALWLRTQVSQSSLAEERSSSTAGDPSIRQTMLEGAATLVPGKPLVIGALDIPGSTRREEIAVLSEPIP